MLSLSFKYLSPFFDETKQFFSKTMPTATAKETESK
jgi:hypothetical protein